MEFEWNPEKSRINKTKHGIDFDTAEDLWIDSNRVEIHTSYPLENRSILIGKIGKNCGRQFSPNVVMLHASLNLGAPPQLE